MKEAHQDQKNQGSLELGDKIDGIKAEYPDQAARSTQQRQLDAMEQEADKALENTKEGEQDKNDEKEGEQNKNNESDNESEQD